jgi:hypothetical protein
VGYHIPCKSAGESANSEKTVGKAKRSSWRMFCQGNEDVPDSARLMEIMAKTVINKVSIIKLPDGNSTASGKGTLCELLKVHFLDSKLIEESPGGQEKLDLAMHKCKTNKDEWHPVRRLINESRIRWTINTFKPFKLIEPDGSMPAFM